MRGRPLKKFLIVSISSALFIGITYFLPYGVWAEIGGLPAHPLIVHGVVILLPLLSLLLLVGIFKKNMLQKFHILIISIIALSTIGVLAAKSSGDSLSAAVGLPEFHAEWGNNLVPLAMSLFVTFVLFSFFTFYKRLKTASSIIAVLMALLAVSTVGMTYVVGHSGAESVWKEKYAFATKKMGSNSTEISLSEVRLHNTSSDCWTVVGEKVYDVTSFISRHPAGSYAIKEMCGKNASEDFLGEHKGQQEPEMWLEKLKIGTLKS